MCVSPNLVRPANHGTTLQASIKYLENIVEGSTYGRSLMEDYYTIDLTAKIIKLLGQSVHGSVGSRSHCQSLERLGSSWASECVLSDRYAVDRL